MRPPGEVRQALLASCRALATPDRGPTLRELAAHAQVGHAVARRTIENMTRHGALHKARERVVEYRNRPVAEYVPPDLAHEEPVYFDLAAVWAAPTA